MMVGCVHTYYYNITDAARVKALGKRQGVFLVEGDVDGNADFHAEVHSHSGFIKRDVIP
jgi:hypothetical protein